MLIMYSSLPIGVSAATSATIVPMPTVILTGVPVRVGLAERGRQQPVARHREDHARLADEQRRDDGRQTGDGTGRDERRVERLAHVLECGGERGLRRELVRAPCRS